MPGKLEFLSFAWVDGFCESPKILSFYSLVLFWSPPASERLPTRCEAPNLQQIR